MKFNRLFILMLVCLLTACDHIHHVEGIDRKAVVTRHNIITTETNPVSPAQVGNGEIAFGVDITGLQTFVPFNILSNWSWHSFPMPEGISIEDYQGVTIETHGRPVRYEMMDPDHEEISQWLRRNPHRFTLGRIGMELKKSDGTVATEADIQNATQEVDLWTGIITSNFTFDGQEVSVKTACHPDKDVIGAIIQSKLVKMGRINVFLDFPYPTTEQFADYLGEYDQAALHTTSVAQEGPHSLILKRNLDSTFYYTALNWTTNGTVTVPDSDSQSHRFYLNPDKTDKIAFTCTFSEKEPRGELEVAGNVMVQSGNAWPLFWNSGAAIDLSGSEDSRWEELERRIVLSQYLMKLNESGSLPPQESGLVNNGWFGRFHFEMIWWHGVHYALWNRWTLFNNYLHIYEDYLPTSIARAQDMGRAGAKWPKCTGNFDREWPHVIHATLIWQQPHPIYFAEQDYRLHPSEGTLKKWKDVVVATADYMADFAFYDSLTQRYVLGPPVFLVSENTDYMISQNPAYELSYWRYGLRTAMKWLERLGLPENEKWKDVHDKLALLPQEDDLYLTYEGIQDMWEKYNFEHPALIGTLGMLPGDGVDTTVLINTLNKINEVWNFDHTWGWDFPMLAMAAARSGNPELAIDFLMHPSAGFQFDEHGLASGGPFPYFPSNGALLTAVAMMAGGWDGSSGDAPGFPKNGQWKVKYENFLPMQ